MKDIDFDELDRAVSSLMGTVPKDDDTKKADTGDEVVVSSGNAAAAEPMDEPRVAVSTNDNTSLTLDEEPVIVPAPEPEVEEPEQSLSTPAPVASTPPPSRGRFMDMVRPSREMRKSPMPASRQGATLQPLMSMRTTEEEAVKSQVVQEQSSDGIGVGFDMQAPDVQGLEDTTSVAASTTTNASPAAEGNTLEETEYSTPLSSPFIPDAKVEKRPLGRPADTTPAVDLSSALSEETSQPESAPSEPSEAVSAPTYQDAQRPEVPLPAELDSKLLSIETGGETGEPAPAHIEATEAGTTSSATVANPPVATAVENAASTTTDTARALAAASIPQQYKLEPSANDEAPASAIYDTQPLAHPTKSKPGWLWVLAIIVILALGAGGGAAVYYLGLL